MSGYEGLYRPVHEPDYDRLYEDDGREDEDDRFEPITCVSCGLEANALDASAAGWVDADELESKESLLCPACDKKAEAAKGCC